MEPNNPSPDDPLNSFIEKILNPHRWDDLYNWGENNPATVEECTTIDRYGEIPVLLTEMAYRRLLGIPREAERGQTPSDNLNLLWVDLRAREVLESGGREFSAFCLRDFSLKGEPYPARFAVERRRTATQWDEENGWPVGVFDPNGSNEEETLIRFVRNEQHPIRTPRPHVTDDVVYDVRCEGCGMKVKMARICRFDTENETRAICTVCLGEGEA